MQFAITQIKLDDLGLNAMSLKNHVKINLSVKFFTLTVLKLYHISILKFKIVI